MIRDALILAKVLIGAFIVSALFLLFFEPTSSPTSQSISVGGSFIGSGRYAVVDEKKGGNALYFGDIGRSPSLTVESKAALWTPFIIDSSRLLVVEAEGSEFPEFRLLQVDLNGGSATCRQLLRGKRYIGWPIAVRGTVPEQILFSSGNYKARSFGLAVSRHRLSVLRSGQVTDLAGAEFLTIGRPTQVASDRFIAPSSLIYLPSGEKIDMIRGTGLADIRIKVSTLTAAASSINDESIGEAWSVTGGRDFETVFVKTLESSPKVRERIWVVDLNNGAVARSVLLPGGRDYGSVFMDPTDASHSAALIMSADSTPDPHGGIFYISEFTDDGLTNERRITPEGGIKIETSSCAEAPISP